MTFLKLLKRLWQGLPLSDHTRWKITVLLLEPILPLLKGSVVRSAYLREKEWQSRRIRPFYGDSLPQLPPQKLQDIFIWGVIDWRLRFQRPQHLACNFAKLGHRVFYISTSFVNTRKTGFEIECLDDKGYLYNIRLHLKGRPLVYAAAPGHSIIERLKQDIAALLNWTGSRQCLSVIQHPFWLELAKALPNSQLVYDCLDLHSGFDNTSEELAVLERSLLKNADAVVTTSQWLHDIAVQYNPKTTVIRNATEYDFFAATPATTYSAPDSQRVIGYFGAIAEWMDVELIEAVARSFPHCRILLVGADECGARQRLTDMPNVVFTGEVKYTELPYYLHGMDVCLLPFRVIPLTLATNPVKIYEYLSAGKPVVAVNLPEMGQFGDLVATADITDRFIAEIGTALDSPYDENIVAARRSFASLNTWAHRVTAFLEVVQTIQQPLISLIVVTYNNIDLSRACLQSVELDTDYPAIEIIVVDNASRDGTPEFLQAWSNLADNRHIILNTENRGFAAANNQGLQLAKGEYLVLLNNDTEITPGWLRTLLRHFQSDPALGLVGPVTNNIGNEAKINIRYSNASEMKRKARTYTLRHMGERFSISTLAFFCVMMPRAVYSKVGPLDEVYGLGFFEDDDYCRRIEQYGWSLACAEDVFVHHHLSASFNKLGKKRKELLENNRKIYEAKWGPWIPHKSR